MRRNFDRRLALIERRVAPGALLDVGSALGFFVRAARARGWDARGIERSAWAAERAAASGVPVVHGDFLTAALAPASFAAVTMLDVLEHTADPRAYVRRARALLRPGGVLAIETADLASPFARLAGRRYHFFTPPNHLTYFTRATLARLLAEEGFADPGFFGVNSELWWEAHAGAGSPVTSFYASRARRILVPMWAALPVWWALALLLRPPELVLTRTLPLWHAAGWLSQVGTGWFVTVIIQLVLVFPLLHAARRAGTATVLAAGLACTLACVRFQLRLMALLAGLGPVPGEAQTFF